MKLNEAKKILDGDFRDLLSLLSRADAARKKHFQNKIKLCAIINARSGLCSENCIFCGQSAHYKTHVDTYPLLSKEEIVKSALLAEKEMKAHCFSIVTSGKGIKNDKDMQEIVEAVKELKKRSNLNVCVSLGTLSKEHFAALKKAGLDSFHHNLETSESYFSNVCTTHSFSDRIKTVEAAKEAGIKVCSGGIFNLGENVAQRLEFAYTLKSLEIENIPLNFLVPVEGTLAWQKYKKIDPLEVLKTIAVFRLILEDRSIGLFGGREFVLGDLQPLMFFAGINMILIGDYLTVKGQSYQKDLDMLKKLGLEVHQGYNNQEAMTK
jgi:biotin synthase